MLKHIHDPFLSQLVKCCIWIVAAMALVSYTGGIGMVALVVIGAWCAIANKTGVTIFFFVLLPFLTISNGALVPKGFGFGALSRIGVLAMTFLMIFSGARRKVRHMIPLGLLFVYLIFALFSSIDGYFPEISYLKVLNCFIFYLGIMLGFKGLNGDEHQLLIMRASMMAFCVVLVIGSLMTLVSPGIAYAVTVSKAMGWGATGSAEDILAQSTLRLFCGVTNHSQALSPIAACASGWVACDMLLVEKRWSWPHVLVIVCAPAAIWLTHSRIGLFSYLIAGVLCFMVVLPKARVSAKVRRKLMSMLMAFVVMLVCAAIYGEIRDQSFSKFLRKKSDINMDTRNLTTALTESRNGAIETNMHDFRRNVMLGSGFQVMEEHRFWFLQGKIDYWSAPIEKGLLPLMVLGETGVVGAIVFTIFLFSFYGTCAKRRYVATAVLFTVLLATNMAEATFFSPSGSGGVEWLLAVGGGFVIDMAVIIRGRSFAFDMRRWQ